MQQSQRYRHCYSETFSFLVRTCCLHYPQCNSTCWQLSQRFRCVAAAVNVSCSRQPAAESSHFSLTPHLQIFWLPNSQSWHDADSGDITCGHLSHASFWRHERLSATPKTSGNMLRWGISGKCKWMYNPATWANHRYCLTSRRWR